MDEIGGAGQQPIQDTTPVQQPSQPTTPASAPPPAQVETNTASPAEAEGKKEMLNFAGEVAKAGILAKEKMPPPTQLADLVASTPALDKLPGSITLPADVYKDMQTLTDKSIDKKGISNEHGGTLALDKGGALKLVNQGAGTSGTFSPDVKVGKDQTYLGTFHTHPYGKNDGKWNGAVLPFSAGDVSTIDDYKEKASIVQSGKNVYVLVPTDKTPATISDAAADKAYSKVFDAEYAAQVKAGKTEAEAAGIAGEKATLELAKKYNLGYYKGENGGALKRVNP
jgi:hypothetical protein